MATKKRGISPNTDKRNIASADPSEIRYVCSIHVKDGKHLTVPDLKQVMKNLGTKDHAKRSREKVYIALKGMGYTRVKPKK